MKRSSDFDQVAMDTLDAQADAEIEFQERCVLDIVVVWQMMKEVARTYRPEYVFVTVLEMVLESHYLTSIERYGYKRALGKIFGRRSGSMQAEMRRFEAATDFPRGQEM